MWDKFVIFLKCRYYYLHSRSKGKKSDYAIIGTLYRLKYKLSLKARLLSFDSLKALSYHTWIIIANYNLGHYRCM